MPPYDPEIQHESMINWTKVVMIFAGIATIVVLITIFVLIPNAVKDRFSSKVQSDLNNLSLNGTTYNCNPGFYSCLSFSTQEQAQSVYDYCQSIGKGDIDHLDLYGTGKACESLP